MLSLVNNLRQQRLPHRLALMLLCVALLLVQTLGQLHRSTHSHRVTHGLVEASLHGNLVQAAPALAHAQTGVSKQATLSTLTGVSLPDSADTGFQGLFKDHQDVPKCQLFDGVGSAQALTSTASMTEVAAQSLILSTHYNILVVQRLTRSFQARAPPYA
jgi:hypothetical protein